MGLQVARVAARRSDTLASAVVFSLASFLVASAALAFGFNLLLRLGNVVAGYVGVLLALTSGIYVLVELAFKLRELARLTTGRGER